MVAFLVSGYQPAEAQSAATSVETGQLTAYGKSAISRARL